MRKQLFGGLMNPNEVNPTVAVLASYIQGRKDGFAAGVVFSVGAVLFWKAYKRGRDGETLLSRIRIDKKK
jgi:hypothetical protein